MAKLWDTVVSEVSGVGAAVVEVVEVEVEVVVVEDVE